VAPECGVSHATLVVELVTEELPPKALARLGVAFADGLVDNLTDGGFLRADSAIVPFATPRRLAVAITNVLATSPDTPLTQKLMPASVALDTDGKPTVALRRKLEAAGRGALADRWPDAAAPGVDRLTRESDGKADAIFLHTVAKGRPLAQGLQTALDATLAKLPIPKVMAYAGKGSYYNDVKFVRPAHRLLALHGSDIVAVRALGLDADRLSSGHRFQSRDAIAVASADAWEETLRAEGKVIARFAERRAAIVAGLHKAAVGATVIMPDALLDEVTALVEWPVVCAGSFPRDFLAVPQECLILTMQQHQKYFALAGADGRLLHRFLLVGNLATSDPSPIIAGNERVLRARLADAKFFFDQDRKVGLEPRLARLETVVYHNQLGTQAGRVARLVQLAGRIAAMTGADRAQAERAARLAKADLASDMVGEFPELQGLMGRFYAEHAGEPPVVAAAIEQHYWPRFAGDALPGDAIAQAVALADKLEALAGLFGIGAVPTGDRDPFGLRRHAIGVIRILIEKSIAVPLPELIGAAYDTFAGVTPVRAAHSEVEGFVHERLRGYLREAGFTANQVEAVLCQRPARIDLVPARMEAVRAFGALPEAEALAAANRRIVNILRKAESEAAVAVDRARLEDGAERDLYLAFQKLEPIVAERCGAADYAAALRALAATRPVVDRFFDTVLVMAEDPEVRANRLALLRGVAATMNRVADISRLAA
jgi:glycyl-tRNA synthetase beta chain